MISAVQDELGGYGLDLFKPKLAAVNELRRGKGRPA